MAVITVHVDHAQYDMGREVQCLNAIIKGDIALQVIRMTGPDLVIGALASMAAYPHVLLRAAEVRQASCPSRCAQAALSFHVTCQPKRDHDFQVFNAHKLCGCRAIRPLCINHAVCFNCETVQLMCSMHLQVVGVDLDNRNM